MYYKYKVFLGGIRVSELIIGIIAGFIETTITMFPTKKNKRIRKNLNLLKQEPWFLEIVNTYNNSYRCRSSVRKILATVDYQKIAHDNQKIKIFKEKLEQAHK